MLGENWLLQGFAHKRTSCGSQKGYQQRLPFLISFYLGKFSLKWVAFGPFVLVKDFDVNSDNTSICHQNFTGSATKGGIYEVTDKSPYLVKSI